MSALLREKVQQSLPPGGRGTACGGGRSPRDARNLQMLYGCYFFKLPDKLQFNAYPCLNFENQKNFSKRG